MFQAVQIRALHNPGLDEVAVSARFRQALSALLLQPLAPALSADWPCAVAVVVMQARGVSQALHTALSCAAF